jgi:hypothetical protein
MDWSEQRHHLAGALGAALTTRLLDLGWIRRAKRAARRRSLAPGAAAWPSSSIEPAAAAA